MNKLIRLSKTGIEYGDYCWNFYSGCRHKDQGKCPPVPCWAEELTRRFKGRYPNGFVPTFYPPSFISPLSLPKKSARVLVNFMGDMFGEWVDPCEGHGQYGADETGYYTFKGRIVETIKKCPHLTFVFLTKNPAGMRAWSPFPDNCEVGFSALNPDEFVSRLAELSDIEARVHWCSIEPLLNWSPLITGNAFEFLDWAAIGALTGTKKRIMELAPRYPALTPWKLSASSNRWGLMPPIEYLKNIVEACDAAGTKVFLKDNLYTWLMDCPPEDRDIYWEDIPNLRHGVRGTG